MENHCPEHLGFATDLGIIKNSVLKMETVFCKHIDEAERQGGQRDRLVIAEQEIAALRKSVWKIGITAGFVGALIGNVAPEVISLFVKFLIGH